MAEASVPVIDLSAWFNHAPGSAERNKIVSDMLFACEKVGFLAITGHNVPKDIIDGAWAVSRTFFDLPLGEKQKVGMKKDFAYGYEQQEVLSRSLEADAVAVRDWKETYSICINATEIPWPAEPQLFQEHVTAYYRTMEKLAAQLMRIFALALKLPEDWFEDKLDRNQSAIRILNYPHQDHAPEPGQLRASAHTDYGSLTILLADNAPGGLQVMNKDGSWQDVPSIPDSFVVNLGDLMARWTNDRWKSTMHRVVNPPRDLGVDTRRQSIAFFHNPNPDTVVECIVAEEGEAPKYPPITAQEHLFSKHYKAVKY